MRVGVIGGGQLARMMIAPAEEIGIELRVLAEADAMAADLAATAVGDYRDAETVLAFARDVDVITFDHEHVPQDVLSALVESGVAVHPGPHALAIAQDKLVMRRTMADIGAPQPDWAAVSDVAQLQQFLDDHDGRAVVKTARGGYDGKGVRVVEAASDVDDWFAALAEDANGGELLVEEVVEFTRELAQQIARRSSGQAAVYPVVETVQADGVCSEVIAPAPSSDAIAADAAALAVKIATELDVTGMLAVELFETADGRILVNELAMRPHNSGHWSQDGAVTGQFEQHLRAVCDLPLGDPSPLAPITVMINILGGPESDSMASRFASALEVDPRVKVHTYGKEPRPGRKVGHINMVGSDLDDVLATARTAASRFA